MMLFEQYGRSNEAEKLQARMSDMWQKHPSMSVDIIDGELQFNPRNAMKGDTMDFTLFYDMYRFQQNNWGGLDILRSDDHGKNFIIDIDDEEFYQVIENLKILLNFHKLHDTRREQTTKVMVKELANFFEIYDHTKPDNFYREYLDYFIDNPEYISLVDWSKKDIEKMSDSEKNLIKSAKGGNKFNVF